MPRIAADPAGLERTGTTLVRVGGQVRDTGLDVHSAWQGLAEAYRTPDAGALLTVMVPLRERAANLGEQA